VPPMPLPPSIWLLQFSALLIAFFPSLSESCNFRGHCQIHIWPHFGKLNSRNRVNLWTGMAATIGASFIIRSDFRELKWKSFAVLLFKEICILLSKIQTHKLYIIYEVIKHSRFWKGKFRI
jgi:hypothetical protein